MTLFGGLAGVAVDVMARPATLRRRASDVYATNGEAIAGVVTETAIKAVVQAPKEADLRMLPEGLRTEAMQLVWTRTALHVDDEVVTEHGQVLRVVSLALRTEAGFTRALAREVKDGGRSL